MSEANDVDAPGDGNDAGDLINRAVLYRRGPIKCGDVERRRLLEEVGCDGEVTFIGDAKAAGRQVTEMDGEDGDGE